MAYAELNTTHRAPQTGILTLVNAAIRDAVRTIATSGSKARQFEALWALGDDELEARGLKRSMLGKYVFADNIWT